MEEWKEYRIGGGEMFVIPPPSASLYKLLGQTWTVTFVVGASVSSSVKWDNNSTHFMGLCEEEMS